MTDWARELIAAYKEGSDDADDVSDALCEFQAERVKDAVSRLREEHSVAILGDPVGTGKTVIALATALRLFHSRTIEQVLVVTPNASVAGLWEERSRRFHDPAFEAALEVRTIGDLPSWRLKATLVVVDEAHRRLSRPQLDKLLKAGANASHRRLFLSATPFQISVGALGELVALGDLEHRTLEVTDALATYGREVTGLARVVSRTRTEGGIHAQPEVREALRLAAGAWAQAQGQVFIPPPSAADREEIGLVDPPQLSPQSVSLESGAPSWLEAFHVARLITQVVGDEHRGTREVCATDSLQRGLASSNEAFWDAKALSELRTTTVPALQELREALEDGLGQGRDHPKMRASAEWIRNQVKSNRHVAVFCVWDKTAVALEETLRSELATCAADVAVYRPPGQVVGKKLRQRFQDPSAEPLVLVLQDRFSESIDLDGACPSLVHHDLPWNPARLRQRWGRFVRARSGFEPIPADRVFIPVLMHESDLRVFDTVRARANIGDILLSDELALHDRSDSELDVDAWVLEALAG